MKHLLFFQLRNVCYNSYNYFSDSLANALGTDAQVEIFSTENEPLENMERYVGQHFDALVDLNSNLPKLKMEDGSYFLDQISAPFFDILLDHPLYHHNMLKHPLKDFHVICLDQNHKKYIETYYPHIVSVHVLPMTGEDIAPDETAYPKKTIDLLFSGSYTPPKEVDAAIGDIPDFMGKITKNLIEKMKKDTSLTQEQALTSMLPDLDEIVEELFPLHMQACFLADSYIRAWRREELLTALAKSGSSMTLCGNGWRKSSLGNFANVSIIDDTDFKDTFSYFRQAKITLNIMPEFKFGAHDRVYSAMLNHSLCLTDSSILLDEQFKDGKELIFYPADKPDILCETVKELLDHPKKIKEISESGYQKAQAEHTWKNRAKAFLQIIN
ncbi:MAG: glycosyltransferase [Roseburia sp.]|nr:glycosyltransferase [Roseburia sp.]